MHPHQKGQVIIGNIAFRSGVEIVGRRRHDAGVCKTGVQKGLLSCRQKGTEDVAGAEVYPSGMGQRPGLHGRDIVAGEGDVSCLPAALVPQTLNIQIKHKGCRPSYQTLVSTRCLPSFFSSLPCSQVSMVLKIR